MPSQNLKKKCLAASKNTDLLEMNCKLIVVACNTATTNAIRELRAKYDIPFGIEPATKQNLPYKFKNKTAAF
jgi:glutamate racemase